MSSNGGDAPKAAVTGATFATALVSGAFSGLVVDLAFYPLDTFRTRAQSPQGFFAAGGFKGIYKGVSSVAVGSAPGGM